MNNFDSLKKDFEDFRNSCGSACASDEEEVEIENEDGFVGTIQKYLLTPQKIGLYFSRLDIKVIGLMADESVQLRERHRMLRDILKSINSRAKMEEIFNIIKEAVDTKVEQYDTLVENFPSADILFEEKKKKAENFKKVLDGILEELDDEVDFI